MILGSLEDKGGVVEKSQLPPVEVGDVELTRQEAWWIKRYVGAVSRRPAGKLISKGLAERIGKELFYPPLWQLTHKGRKVRDALLVQEGLERMGEADDPGSASGRT